MKILFRIAFALALVAFATAAFAGETGSISGFVKDGTGQAVPGATVRLTGAQAPQNTVTGASGAFRFPVLLPGNYVATAELKGLGIASQKVLVLVDNDVQLNLVLVQTAKAEIVVTGAVAEIDKKASEVNFNYTDNVIKDLPVSRSYEGLLKIVPGAPATSGQGFVSVSGGTRQDNKYFLDGVNITNPGYGFLGIDTNQLDIADFNVKKAGISAEFGRTSGAMFNAVTKSGSNQLFGTVQFNFTPSSFQADYKYATQRDTGTWVGAGNVGFPIIKDTLFGYASAQYTDTKVTGQTATIGDVTTTQADTKSHFGDYFGKLTAFIGQPVLLNAGFRAMPNKSTDAYNSIYDAPTAAYGADTTNYLGNVSADWFATKDTVVEAKYVYLSEDDTSVGQTLIDPFQPMTINPKNLGAYGAWANPSRKNGNVGVYEFQNTGDKYKRSEIKLTVSQFLDIGGTQNQFKLGGGYEDDSQDTVRATNGWGVFSTGITCPKGVCNPTATVPGTVRARYYTSQPVQYSKARTYSLFIQDTITWKNLTVYLGLLANRDDFAQLCPAGKVCGPTGTAPYTQDVRYNFMTFHWDQQLQPRLGVTWNTNLIPGDKLYSTYGEYAGVDQKSTARSFAPYRSRQDEAFFDGTTGVYLGSQFRGSSTSKYIPPDLKPPYYQEWVIGYSAAFAKDYSFDVYYQYRNIKDAFEDVPIDPDNPVAYKAANLPWARRVYRAVTLDVQKRYTNGWYADANITFSKLYGNYDADYDIAIFNTSGILEDGPGVNTAEPFRYGRLGQDRPVIFKLMGSYDFPFGVTLGGFLRVQSGAAFQAQGKEPSSTTGQERYLEPAGSQRYPTWTTFDMLGAYTFKLGGNMSVRVEARVTNLFDSQTVLSVTRLKYLDPYVPGVPPRNMGPQGTSQPNPLYGTPSSWAAPRRLVLTAQLNF